MMTQHTGQLRMEMIKTYLEKSPGDSFLKHALALEHLKTGEDEIAIRLFKELLDHDPNYVGSYYHLGKVLEKTGDLEQAAQVYEKGIQIAKNLGDNHARQELQTAYDEWST